jgi:hypothetical protein
LEKWHITFLKIMSMFILDIQTKNGYDPNEQ